MNKRIFVLCIFALLLLSACVRDYENTAAYDPGEPYGAFFDEPTYIIEQCAREELLAQGWTECMLDSLVEGGISFENVLNQARFGGYVCKIYNGQPIGPSGEVIAPQYHGGLYFNNDGILTVMVLQAAFDHEPSTTAIEEMRELGIIVRTATFTQDELMSAQDRLFSCWDRAREAGVSGAGLGTINNKVTVWLSPYTEEFKVKFTELLLELSLSPAMFHIEPAFSQEMLDYRAALITRAIQYGGELVVPVGEVVVSRTGITFSLQNRTNSMFYYGEPWDLAYYDNGRWRPVPYMPGVGSGWRLPLFMLQGGGIKQYHISFEWRFGELPPGRYMFIRDGYQGEWCRNGSNNAYALVEFFITEDSPVQLPPQIDPWDLPSIINLVEFSRVTPTGMRIVVDNISPYDVEHRAQILAMVPEEHTHTGHSWEWQWYGLPFLPDAFDFHIQGEGFLPSSGTLEFDTDWTHVFGILPPGDYVLLLSVGGKAHPPHPTGWAFGDTMVIRFTV
ncbi:MAG: hypothetical protein FWC32_14090 [Firmicutes bacterium]|nr:hypothetical protein [Bacillota bacterium]